MATRPRCSTFLLGLAALAAGGLTSLTPATAQELVTYTYDARGRLVKVAQSGTVNNGVAACYSYDRADNRENVTVAATGCNSPDGGSVENVYFTISDASISEHGMLEFVVTRAGSTSGSHSVSFATANGTAVAGLDYTAQSGTLTFMGSESSKYVFIATLMDGASEGSETMFVNLSGATADATIQDSRGTGTILNVECAQSSLSQDDSLASGSTGDTSQGAASSTDGTTTETAGEEQSQMGSPGC